MKRRLFASMGPSIGLLALTGPTPLYAQAWPDKPIKLVLSQPAGAGPDIVARMLGERLGRALGQAIVVENKPGGQNVIGAQAAARAAPDGYTFYFATTAALVSNSYLFKTIPYDPQKDFVPVAFVATSPFSVVVKADSPITSIQDLIARSKAKPGTLSIGNEGPRTFGGIVARVFNARAQAQANLVAYANVGVAVQDLLGGHVDSAVVGLSAVAQLVSQGRVRVLAVTTAKRLAEMEQVPALSELFAGFELVGWLGVVAPTGTPTAVVARMNVEISKLLADRELAERILATGASVRAGSSEQFAAFLKEEHLRWAQISKEIGLLPE